MAILNGPVPSWAECRLANSISIVKGRSKRERMLLSRPVAAGDGILVQEWFQSGELVKLDRYTLELSWRTSVKGLLPVQALDDSLVLAGGQSRVGIIEIRSGRLLWDKPSASSPCVWSGRIIARTKTAILVLDAASGETVRCYELPWSTEGFIVCGARVIVLQCHGLSGCIDLNDGRVLWERDLSREFSDRFPEGFTSDYTALTPGSTSDLFLAAREPRLFGISVEDGSIRWASTNSITYRWPNVSEGRVYFLSGDRFTALDERSGEIVYQLADQRVRELLLPKVGTIHQGMIAFASESGHLVVFDMADGRLVWANKFNEGLSHTAEVDGRLLVTTMAGNLLVLAGQEQ